MRLREMRLSKLAAAERSELEVPAPLWRRADPDGNLPRQLTRFVGRQRDLEQLRQALRSVRLLTLTGTGGIGKTRLAIELAELVRPGYQDGVWLVDLAPLADPTLVAHAVAGALGVRAETEVSVAGALLEFSFAQDAGYTNMFDDDDVFEYDGGSMYYPMLV